MTDRLLVTVTSRTVEINPQTDELKATVVTEVVAEKPDVVRDALRKREAGDVRFVGYRAFELSIDEKGTPTVGRELTQG